MLRQGPCQANPQALPRNLFLISAKPKFACLTSLRNSNGLTLKDISNTLLTRLVRSKQGPIASFTPVRRESFQTFRAVQNLFEMRVCMALVHLDTNFDHETFTATFHGFFPKLLDAFSSLLTLTAVDMGEVSSAWFPWCQGRKATS